ncbi:MAG: trigger factor [Bacteroidetes bacterium]|nr:trigger factor [Bacteroidota bacterium]
MATVTRSSIGQLHDRLTVTLDKKDYLPSFEKSVKDYGRKANIPGFRKGMVPTGLIKKMVGPSLFTDEVLKTVDRELIGWLQTEKIEIFAQPLPLEADFNQLDFNNPLDYTFHFEIGCKPAIQLPDLAKTKVTRYVVTVTDEMIDNELTRLQNRYGNMKDQESVNSEEDVINVHFTEVDASGQPVEGGAAKDNSLLVKYFAESVRKQWMGKKVGEALTFTLAEAFEQKEREWLRSDLGFDKTDTAADSKPFSISITKIGLLEKRELNEEFFEQLYPGKEIKTTEGFREKIKEEIQAHWNAQATNQIHDQLYHQLVDHTPVSLPEAFLKKWLQTQGENPKTPEQADEEYPKFAKQLKWTLLSEKMVADNGIQVDPQEIRQFAKQQLFSYMGGAAMAEEQPWVNDYAEKMMKDRKYVEDAFHRIQTQKIFEWATTQLKPTDKAISAEDFTTMVESHQHDHH